jgi:ribosomal-protein-alanine N-acetyltransferase
MEIRFINELDLPDLLAIEEASQPTPWSEAAFKRCQEACYPGWLLVEENKVIGFVYISVMAGECHVLNLCVAPQQQRKGFGKQLLLTALTWAKQQGAGVVYLEVRRSNHQAIALYRIMNFKRIGERKEYYTTESGREDAIIFARDIGVEDI